LVPIVVSNIHLQAISYGEQEKYSLGEKKLFYFVILKCFWITFINSHQ